MPAIPTLYPEPEGNFGQSVVFANPHMFDQLHDAQQRIGQGIEQAGDLGFRIKRATDATYLVSAQTQAETAQKDFETWTKQNPDTSTWQDEYERRMGELTSTIEQNGTALSPLAKQHLQSMLTNFQATSASRFKMAKTEQDLSNAKGAGEEGVNAAIAGNDAQTAHQIIDTMTTNGVFHPAYAAALKKRVTVGIASNQANAAIEQDPFGAPALLTAKDGSGNYVNFQGLPQSSREMAIFRANKMASETRSQTMQMWSSQVAQAQKDGTPMPDEDGLRAEAAHQGINPKFVDKLFAPPKGLDTHAYAQTYNAISTYDPQQDPTHEQLAQLVGQVETFKDGGAKERLNKLLTSKTNPKDPINSPVGKELSSRLEQAFQAGMFGKFKVTIPGDPTAEPTSPASKPSPKFLDQVYVKAMQSKELVQASLGTWLKANPNATVDEAAKFMAGEMKHARGAAGVSLFTPPSTVPSAPKQ